MTRERQVNITITERERNQIRHKKTTKTQISIGVDLCSRTSLKFYQVRILKLFLLYIVDHYEDRSEIEGLPEGVGRDFQDMVAKIDFEDA